MKSIFRLGPFFLASFSLFDGAEELESGQSEQS
jgi:hypothetical protein